MTHLSMWNESRGRSGVLKSATDSSSRRGEVRLRLLLTSHEGNGTDGIAKEELDEEEDGVDDEQGDDSSLLAKAHGCWRRKSGRQ